MSGTAVVDYYGTEMVVEVVGASPGLMVDLERRFSTAKPPENRAGPTDFDRLAPADAIGLAVELLNAAQEAGEAVGVEIFNEMHARQIVDVVER